MQTRLTDWIDDPRVVTLVVTTLIALALWVATWSVMGRMDMGAMGMGGMGMSEMEMSDMNQTGMNQTDMGPAGMDQTGKGETGMGEAGMDRMDMGMDMGMMSPDDWSLRRVYEASLMWLLMMAAMMLPAMAPVMAIYSGIAAKEDRGARLALRIAIFTSGYFLLWALVSITMALIQLGLRGSDLFTMHGTQATPIAAAGLMLAAGVYQLSTIKDACLRHCRHPLTYLLSHWREGIGGAFQVGARHGVYCVGCCIIFMGLMFVFGAMNVWWMAIIALYFLAEKIAPAAETWSRWVGYLLIAAGLGTGLWAVMT